MTTYYPLGDYLPAAELHRLDIQHQGLIGYGGAPSHGVHARGKRTGEFRAPRKGEWYVSGAIPAAYRAPNDLTTEYHIARIVLVKYETVTREIEIEPPTKEPAA